MSAAAMVGVIGGSGVYDLDGVEEAREHRAETPWGEPSDAILVGRLGDVPVAFLPRHGRDHRYAPHELPYRANVMALRALGVHQLLSVSAVGSLDEDCAPGDFVLVDQFVDRTTRRAQTFFGDGAVAHLPMAEPVDAAMAEALAAAAQGVDVRLHRGGSYVCIEGPQFSTRAESELYRSWGCRVVGMTNGTEAKLAREAGMRYACVAMVTDYDCWHPEHGDVDVAQIIAVMKANARHAAELVRRAVPALGALGPSPWRAALRDCLLTPPERMPPRTRARLAPLLDGD